MHSPVLVLNLSCSVLCALAREFCLPLLQYTMYVIRTSQLNAGVQWPQFFHAAKTTNTGYSESTTRNTLGARGFFSRWGRQNIERRSGEGAGVAKRREKNLWHQPVTTSLPCRRQFPLIDIRRQSLF